MRARIFVVVLVWALLWALLCALAGCGGGAGPGSAGEPGVMDRSGNEEDPGNADGSEGTADQALSLGRMELLQPEEPENENLADMLQKAGSGMMVQIQAGGLLGSGVICGTAEDQLLILTAGHVLREAQAENGDVRVIFADGADVPAHGFECSDTADFALVRVSGSEIPSESLGRYLSANIDKTSFDQAVTGTGCIVMGSRSDVAAEAYEGVILDHWIYMKDYGQYMMWVKAEGLPGMSGGGLFDRQGHFLGVLSGGNEDGELAVVPLSLILPEVALFSELFTDSK